MGIFNNIQNALNTRLSTMPGLPEIFWPNTEGEPQRDTDWMRTTLLPANSDLFTIANENQHQGIYQIDLYTKLKEGTSPILSLADTIRTHFKQSPSLTSGGDTIHIQAISISSPRRDDAWWSCYVQINYLAFN